MGKNISSHDALVKKIDELFKKAGFLTDTKVIIELDEQGTTKEYEFDVCAIYQEIMIIIECKAGSNQQLKNLVLEWVAKKGKFEKFDRKIKNSTKKQITSQLIKNIDNFKILFVANNFEPTQTNYKQVHSENMELWDSSALDYYTFTIDALSEWSKYEIMKELSIQPAETKTKIVVPAIKIKQPVPFVIFCPLRHHIF